MNRPVLMIVIPLVVLIPSIAIAIFGYRAINAIGEHPSMAAGVFVGNMIGVFVAEVVSIISLLVIFNTFAT